MVSTDYDLRQVGPNTRKVLETGRKRAKDMERFVAKIVEEIEIKG